jgi:GNAT superfamily N-acetyltransferase
MIRYLDNADSITPKQLQGFFVGWPNPPSPATHLRLLRQSAAIVLAVDEATAAVVGFINAVSDGVLCAYIPLVEVLPAWQGQGIGRQLIERMLARLATLYAIDLLCDAELQPFYARLGMRPATGMMVRNYARQSGE